MSQLEQYCQRTTTLDNQTKGWLLQFAAWIAYCTDRKDEALQIQQHAYAANRNLLKPQLTPKYIPLISPGQQAHNIVNQILKYTPRRAYLSVFDEVISHLIPAASANQFEQALVELGETLGFAAERPEKIYGLGPDILWLLNSDLGLVIEAKSRKLSSNAFNKANHGQLLVSTEWFKQEYPNHRCERISIHPTVVTTKEAIALGSKVLTLTKLNELVSDARIFLEQLTDSAITRDQLLIKCEQLLKRSTFVPERLVDHYLAPFEIKE